MEIVIVVNNHGKSIGDITLKFKKLRAAKKVYHKLVKRWNHNKVVDIPTHAMAILASDISYIYIRG